MNPVENEEVISELGKHSLDAAAFPFEFLTACGNKSAASSCLQSGNSNQADITSSVLQRSSIHIAACATSTVHGTFTALRASPKATG